MYLQNRKRLLSILKVLMGIILIYLLIHSSRIKMELLLTLLHQPYLFLELVICFIIMLIAATWRWHLLNSARGIQLRFNQSFFATYTGAAFSNILPSSVGGDVIRLLYVYKQSPQKKSEATLSLVSDRILGFLGIFSLLLFVTVSNISALDQQPVLIHIILLCNLFCLGLLTSFFLTIWLTKRSQLANWLNKKISNSTWSPVIVSFFKTLSNFKLAKKVIIKCLALSIFIQLLITLSVMLIANMMGFAPIAFSHLILAVGIIQIVNLIPLTPGGIGVGELAFANVLLILNPGINAAYATIFFAYRLISVLIYLPAMACFTYQLGSIKQASQVD